MTTESKKGLGERGQRIGKDVSLTSNPRPSVPGFFIVFEGPEGAGKSTQIRHLVACLREVGYAPVMTKEPGGTPAAEAVRKVILNPDLTIGPLSEFLLYSASRAQHVEEVIRPALETGKLLISDRFYGASVAYQGYGRGLELDFIQTLTERATGGLKPDLTLLLDVDPREGLARVAARGNADRLERSDLSFHERVREGFLAQAEADSIWVIMDAGQREEALAADIWRAVQGRMGL